MILIRVTLSVQILPLAFARGKIFAHADNVTHIKISNKLTPSLNYFLNKMARVTMYNVYSDNLGPETYNIWFYMSLLGPTKQMIYIGPGFKAHKKKYKCIELGPRIPEV